MSFLSKLNNDFEASIEEGNERYSMTELDNLRRLLKKAYKNADVEPNITAPMTFLSEFNSLFEASIVANESHSIEELDNLRSLLAKAYKKLGVDGTCLAIKRERQDVINKIRVYIESQNELEAKLIISLVGEEGEPNEVLLDQKRLDLIFKLLKDLPLDEIVKKFPMYALEITKEVKWYRKLIRSLKAMLTDGGVEIHKGQQQGGGGDANEEKQQVKEPQEDIKQEVKEPPEDIKQEDGDGSEDEDCNEDASGGVGGVAGGNVAGESSKKKKKKKQNKYRNRKINRKIKRQKQKEEKAKEDAIFTEHYSKVYLPEEKGKTQKQQDSSEGEDDGWRKDADRFAALYVMPEEQQDTYGNEARDPNEDPNDDTYGNEDPYWKWDEDEARFSDVDEARDSDVDEARDSDEDEAN